MVDKYKVMIRKKDFSLMVLLCTQCYHEIEVVRHEGEKCDWCGGDMMIIGQGTTWPSLEDYKIIATKKRNNCVV